MPSEIKPKVRKVADIKAKLLNPALTSHFEVQIPLPNGAVRAELESIRPDGGEQQDALNIRCTNASLPGSNLATLELNNTYHGVTQRHAYRRVYDDRIDLEFLVDADDYLPIRFFEKWIDSIMLQTQGGEGNESPVSQSYSYRASYSDDYVCSSGLKIVKFERTGKNGDYTGSALEYTFVNAYPFTISSMPISYDSSSLLKCTVSFSYLRYVINDVIKKPSTTPGTIGNPKSAKPGSKQTPALTKQNQNTGELNSIDDIINRGKVGDKVSASLAADLDRFGRGNINVG
tara:strand:+ start:552 stop:1415 length:864 start_codon:yes stop_codon:yes gene_type:complete